MVTTYVRGAGVRIARRPSISRGQMGAYTLRTDVPGAVTTNVNKDGPAAVVHCPASLRTRMRQERGGGALAPNSQIRVQTRSTGDVQEEERAGGGGPATAENGCCNAKRGVDRCARGSNYVGWGGWQRG